eukprot:TRINITY_DN6102_c0_g2_i1.p1 TRINITY_DN6102_c0_g2~~TRINITY_DN6102_c0_g2_i1.p1  ORF type:complete len:277 (+),score=99.90 TRINITY_DN6102_c0_g2_i1:107-937(+)
MNDTCGSTTTDGFNVAKKLSEVRGVYGALPSIEPRRGRGTDAGSSTARSMDDGTLSVLTTGTAASTVSTGRLNGKNIRFRYGEEAHANTHSNKLRGAARERRQQEAAAKQARKQRSSLLRRKLMDKVEGKAMECHKTNLEETVATNKEAKQLMLEIKVWAKKLRNCQAELQHRKLEYRHVLQGGELLDPMEDAFDSDEERDYPSQQLFLSCVEDLDSDSEWEGDAAHSTVVPTPARLSPLAPPHGAHPKPSRTASPPPLTHDEGTSPRSSDSARSR